MPPLPEETLARLASCRPLLRGDPQAADLLARLEAALRLDPYSAGGREAIRLAGDLCERSREEALWAQIPLEAISRWGSRLGYSPANEWLARSVFAANEPAARACLRAGARADQRDELGAGLVWLAACKSLPALRLALDLAPDQALAIVRPDPEHFSEEALDRALDESGWVPLHNAPAHAASRHGKPDCLRLLLELGAAPDERTGNGERALGLAICSPAPFPERAECVRALAESGAALDWIPGDDLAPLALAARFSDEPMALLLLELGADLRAPYSRTFGGAAPALSCEAIPDDALPDGFAPTWRRLCLSWTERQALSRAPSSAPARRGPGKSL